MQRLPETSKVDHPNVASVLIVLVRTVSNCGPGYDVDNMIMLQGLTEFGRLSPYLDRFGSVACLAF